MNSRVARWIAAVGIAATATAATAEDRVYFVDGTSFEVERYEVQGSLLLLVMPDGKRFTVPLSTVDMDRTRGTVEATTTTPSLASPPPRPTPREIDDATEALVATAEAYIAAGDYTSARESLELASSQPRAGDEPGQRASLSGVFANLSLATGEIAEAAKYLDEAIEQAAIAGAESVSAASYTNRGTQLLAQEQWSDAVAS